MSQKEIKNILIRMPNWLGDMVMATAFLKAVAEEYPAANIDLIVKKGLEFLCDYFPAHGKRYVFSKEKYPGLKGAKKFGKEISCTKEYGLFFCLPDSLSSAVMGKAAGAEERIGFKKNINRVFFTKVYKRKKDVHRAEEYADLLQQYLGKNITGLSVSLSQATENKKDALIININSEASSRRLPKEKAISLINTVREKITEEIILVGSPKEKPFVDEVYEALNDKINIRNVAGETSLPDLVKLLSSCKAMLSTDSGPAHVANAAGVNTLVLFGAGNENNTAPYNAANRKIIRLGKLSCEPCLNNVCNRYGTPECLLQLDETMIAENIKILLKKNGV